MTAQWDEQSGSFLSAEHQRIAEIIHDYQNDLELAWVPPKSRELNEAYPFAVIHRPEGSEPYVVMRLKEDEVDHRVLSRLWKNDNTKHDVLGDIEREENAARVVMMKMQQEIDEEANELAAFMVKAPVGARVNGLRLE